MIISVTYPRYTAIGPRDGFSNTARDVANMYAGVNSGGVVSVHEICVLVLQARDHMVGS